MFLKYLLSVSIGFTLLFQYDAVELLNHCLDKNTFQEANIELNVKENTPVGTILAIIPNENDASNDTIALEAIYQVTPQFEIENRLLKLNQPFELKITNRFDILIDCNSLPMATRLHIRILVDTDKNDLPPRFIKSTYRFSIAENKPVGTVVGSIEIVPQDNIDASNVHYKLDGAAHHNGLLSIDSVTAQIFTHAVLDYENLKWRTLNTTVIMSTMFKGKPFSASAQVIITVEDEDDNPSTSENNMYVGEIHRSASIGAGVNFIDGNKIYLQDNDSFEMNVQIVFQYPNNLFGVQKIICDASYHSTSTNICVAIFATQSLLLTKNDEILIILSICQQNMGQCIYRPVKIFLHDKYYVKPFLWNVFFVCIGIVTILFLILMIVFIFIKRNRRIKGQHESSYKSVQVQITTI